LIFIMSKKTIKLQSANSEKVKLIFNMKWTDMLL
jgi:hypothetical protein